MILLEKEKINEKSIEELELYNSAENDPKSSVIESSDYDFAISRYKEDDFRYEFVKKYIEYIKEKYGVNIFNCKFERPDSYSKFINFYIYLWQADPDIHYRIEDEKNKYIESFYEILKSTKLLGITETTEIQFLVKDILKTMISHSSNKAWNNIHKTIKSIFSEVVVVSYWNTFYVFINDDDFEKTVLDKEYLNEIRKYCYKATKEYDVDNVLDYSNFHIRIDNYKNYKEIGGQNYFNSDYMFNCITL